MRTIVLLSFVLFAIVSRGQSPCDHVKLYDEIIVKGDQPTFPKMKRFNKNLIPDSTLLKIKTEIIRATSAEFFSGLKMRSAKLFDSAVATAWSWTHEPITDKHLNPVYFFYSIIFETTSVTNTPFVFRLDFLKNGDMLNKNQISFLNKGKLDIIGCKKMVALVMKDTIQPVNSIDYMCLAFSNREQAVVWTVASVADPKTGIQYFKEINAVTGKIIRRSFSDLNAPPQVEEIKVQKEK